MKRNSHYTQRQEIDQEKVFRPKQEGKPLEVTRKLEKLGKKHLSEEHFEDLKEKRGLEKETIEQYIRPVNQEIIEELEEEFESETLVQSGWYKFSCQACNSGTTFEERENFTEHLEEEHGRKDFDKYSEWLYSMIPEQGYLIKYADIGNKGELVYANIRDRNPEDQSYKYRQPHLSSVEARKSYKQGIFPAFDEIGGETLVITEGEFKSLALKEQDWDSLAIAGVNLSQSNLDRLSRICSQYDQVVYVIDDDMGGLLSVPSMTSEMQSRNQRIQAQVSKQKDIDDKHAEGETFELQPKKPVKLLKNNLERLDRKEHAISKYGKPEDLLEVFFQTVQGLKRSKQESKVKKTVKKINKELDEELNSNTVKSELNDWRKQFNRKKRQQRRDKEESQEEVSKFQDQVKVDGEEIALNPVEYVNIQTHVKTETELPKNDKGVVRPDPQFKIFEVAFGEGSEEDTFLLFTEPEREMNLGEKFLPLKQADLGKQEYSDWLKKKFRDAQEDGFEGSFQDFKKEKYEGRVLEIADYIDQESIRKIKDMDNQTIREEIVEKYLNNGHKYDEKLTKLNHAKIVRHDKSKVDAEDVMPYNPHSAYITATKIGKSYNSNRVGVKMDKMSSSGLLGYASADDLRKGTLDGMHEPFFADEIRHGNEENIGDKLLTIFEEGSSRISKGQKDMRPEFYGSFTYMSNPKKSDDMDQIDYFMDFVEKLGNNSQALGSRLGVLLFDLGNLDKATGTPLDKEERRKLETMVDWIKEEVAEEYAEIEQELQEWLHQEYPKSYKNRIDGWKAKMYSQKANDFLEGHKDSFRHARGQALRMAVYENIGKVLKKNYSIEEIRKDADDKFRELLDINLYSISNLTDALSDKDRVRQHKQALLEAEETTYLKLFVKSVISKAKEDEDVFRSIEPIQSLKPVYHEIRENLDSVDDSSKYWKFSEIRYKLEENLGRANKRLRDRYGLKLNEDGGNLFVKISDHNTFKVYPEVSSNVVPEIEEMSPESPKSPEGSEKTTPPTHLENQETEEKLKEPGEKKGMGGGEKEKPRGDFGDIGDRSQDSVKILQAIKDGGLNKIGLKKELSEVDNLKKLAEELEEEGLIDYNGTVYSLTDKGQERLEDREEQSSEESSVIISEKPEIGEDISEEQAVEILEVFQEEGPLKKAKANNKANGSIEDFNGKVSDLKKIGLLNYDRHSHQYSLSEEGKGLIQNEGLESVFSQEEVKAE